MAWDNAVNHRIGALGANIEVGYATLVAASTDPDNATVEVPTKMTKVYSAVATFAADPGSAAPIVCDRTITSGGVTFSAGNADGIVINYILIGK